MSDYKFPDLPSDEELGITDDDRDQYEQDVPNDEPELSEAEMAMFLGESAGKEKPNTKSEAKAEAKAAREAKRKNRKATKQARKSDEPPAGPKPVTEPVPRRRWRGPITLALFVGISVVASTRTGLPRPVPANALDTAFSSSRAMSTLVEIASASHPTGSPEHARVREFLLDRLRSLGLEAEVQTATSAVVAPEDPRVTRVATVRNIVARIPGQASTGAVLITAHYDSRPISVGASDDGAGIVSITEAIRAIQADEPLRNDVIVLLTDGEELGLLGARAFVDQHRWMVDVSLVVSLEMRGGGGPSLMFETNAQNGWVVEAVEKFDSYPITNSLFFEVYKRLPNDTDFSPFKAAGVQGLNFAAIDNAHIYHQASDRPENLSERTLQHHGIHALGALKYFGQADLGNVNAPDMVYLTVPWLGLIAYAQGWVLPLSGALLFLFGLCILSARRAGARLGATAAGLGVSVLAGVVTFSSAAALLAWLPRFHAELGALRAATYHSEGWYVLALVFGALSIVTALTTVAGRWLSGVELALGALILPLAGAIILSFAAPLAAMNLQWPVLAALLGVTGLALLGPRSEGMAGWIAAVVLAVPVLVILVPITELVWIAMSIQVAGILSVLTVVLLLLCLPALAALNHPNGWWAPMTGLVLAGAALGIGVVTSRPDSDRPAPSTLLYAYEHGSGAAVWATSTDEEDSEARAWAVQQASGPFSSTRDLRRFGYGSGQTLTAPAPVVAATPPSVVIVSDTVTDGERRVEILVHSRIGAETIMFVPDPERNTRILFLDGVPITESEDFLRVDYWGVPENDVSLELVMPPDEPIGLQIVEHLLRPQELLGKDTFVRPDHLAPNVNMLSDRAIFSYSVAAFADPRYAILLPRTNGTQESPDAIDPTDIGAFVTGRPDTGVPIDTLDLRADTLVLDTLEAVSDTIRQ